MTQRRQAARCLTAQQVRQTSDLRYDAMIHNMLEIMNQAMIVDVAREADNEEGAMVEVTIC